jgi:hypothetical protein
MKLIASLFVLSALVAAACGGDDVADADSSLQCTAALYDTCATNDDCDSEMCKTFNGEGFTVCTQACTVGDNTTCPESNGITATCNNMGICKPAAANDCD